MYWIGFRVPDGARAIVATSFPTYEKALAEYERKKATLQYGEQLIPPLAAETEDEALQKMYETFGT